MEEHSGGKPQLLWRLCWWLVFCSQGQRLSLTVLVSALWGSARRSQRHRSQGGLRESRQHSGRKLRGVQEARFTSFVFRCLELETFLQVVNSTYI